MERLNAYLPELVNEEQVEAWLPDPKGTRGPQRLYRLALAVRRDTTKRDYSRIWMLSCDLAVVRLPLQKIRPFYYSHPQYPDGLGVDLLPFLLQAERKRERPLTAVLPTVLARYVLQAM